ncbi:MAG: UDP-N-acetylmuramate dehydrogenase [Solirubrobacteraceae bacterium]|nr:UDP-N-acetylmuramate dehydrogenase [Solirubrobacteraceae bacterium]
MTVRLSDLTTLGLGGPAGRLVDATTEDELVAEVRAADRGGEPVLVVAGGSNLVVSDAGFTGTVVRILTRGIEAKGHAITVAAGESWDAFVAGTVERGASGIECLAGIPGSVGATPIQNVGAYGQEVAETITSVRVLDRRSGAIAELKADACGFSYRSSAFKREPGRWLVLAVTFALEPAETSRPVRYAELARPLGVSVGATAPLADVREAVLGLRRGKGMVLDIADPDTASAGSFFTNPVLSAEAYAALQARSTAPPPGWPEPDGRVKTSAAWLIEQAGFKRGEGDPDGIAISTKHVLALTNRGHGTAAELLSFARRIAAGVRETFGVELVPEPVLVGLDWP